MYVIEVIVVTASVFHSPFPMSVFWHEVWRYRVCIEAKLPRTMRIPAILFYSSILQRTCFSKACRLDAVCCYGVPPLFNKSENLVLYYNSLNCSINNTYFIHMAERSRWTCCEIVTSPPWTCSEISSSERYSQA